VRVCVRARARARVTPLVAQWSVK